MNRNAKSSSIFQQQSLEFKNGRDCFNCEQPNLLFTFLLNNNNNNVPGVFLSTHLKALFYLTHL